MLLARARLKVYGHAFQSGPGRAAPTAEQRRAAVDELEQVQGGLLEEAAGLEEALARWVPSIRLDVTRGTRRDTAAAVRGLLAGGTSIHLSSECKKQLPGTLHGLPESCRFQVLRSSARLVSTTADRLMSLHAIAPLLQPTLRRSAALSAPSLLPMHASAACAAPWRTAAGSARRSTGRRVATRRSARSWRRSRTLAADCVMDCCVCSTVSAESALPA